MTTLDYSMSRAINVAHVTFRRLMLHDIALKWTYRRPSFLSPVVIACVNRFNLRYVELLD